MTKMPLFFLFASFASLGLLACQHVIPQKHFNEDKSLKGVSYGWIYLSNANEIAKKSENTLDLRWSVQEKNMDISTLELRLGENDSSKTAGTLFLVSAPARLRPLKETSTTPMSSLLAISPKEEQSKRYRGKKFRYYSVEWPSALLYDFFLQNSNKDLLFEHKESGAQYLLQSKHLSRYLASYRSFLRHQRESSL